MAVSVPLANNELFALTGSNRVLLCGVLCFGFLEGESFD